MNALSIVVMALCVIGIALEFRILYRMDRRKPRRDPELSVFERKPSPGTDALIKSLAQHGAMILEQERWRKEWNS